jgi:predicted flap endonuclease-1-like 5' DNA nuclease
MLPITERALWFVLGFVVGALLAWIATRRRAAPAATAPAPVPATFQPDPAPRAEPVDTAEAAAAAHIRIDVGAARAAGFNLKHADDLSIIEGIGPRIQDLLRQHGIDGFARMAQLRTDELLDILDRGGPSFRLADPSTWAEQASLALHNRWGDLKRLQRDLHASTIGDGRDGVA